MTGRRAIPTPFALLACLVLASPSDAHEFKLDSLINGFVKIEPDRAQLVVRLPLHVTRTIKFPVRGAVIDLANAGPAVQQALGALGNDLTLYEDGRPLPVESSVGRLSLPSDRSFESYERAVEHVSRPAEADSDIFI